jgi:uncharacterized membrane protein YedE/YeeE
MEIVNFTPTLSFVGGLLIGLSATLLLLLNGRIAGISGICKSVFQKNSPGDSLWRILFILGLVAGGFLYSHFQGVEMTAHSLNISWTKIVLGAIFVGVGTSLGNGCTSGHGICGLSRKSLRSFTATMVFMAFGMLTVYFVN